MNALSNISTKKWIKLAEPEGKMSGSSTMERVFEEGETTELVARSQGGCLVSYERLVEQYQDRLFTFLVQIVGNDHDAEDIAQESFVKAYTHLASYDGRARFSTWLFAIAKNTAYNHLRRRKHHQPIEELAEVLPTAEPSIDGSERESIWAAAKTLKPKLFETLWLFYAEGFALKEIAEIMNTNSINVRVNLHRARTALGKKLERLNAPGIAPRVVRS